MIHVVATFPAAVMACQREVAGGGVQAGGGVARSDAPFSRRAGICHSCQGNGGARGCQVELGGWLSLFVSTLSLSLFLIPNSLVRVTVCGLEERENKQM